jgi:hypothetical protein
MNIEVQTFETNKKKLNVLRSELKEQDDIDY